MQSTSGKTVTVGISRSDEEIIQLNLVTNMLEAGTPRDRISYKNLRYLAQWTSR